MAGPAEPHASIRMVRAMMAHSDPIFFLGATDTKNRLDAGKHCRTWIEVDVPPAQASQYQSRVDIALVRIRQSFARAAQPCSAQTLSHGDTVAIACHADTFRFDRRDDGSHTRGADRPRVAQSEHAAHGGGSPGRRAGIV